MKKQPLILLITIVALGGGAYYWLNQSEETPVILDTTLDKYDETLAAGKKCTETDPINTSLCQKVLTIFDQQIKLITKSKKKKKKYEKQLTTLYKGKIDIERKLGDDYAAIKTLKKIIDLDPQNPINYARLSGYYTEIKAFKEAVNYARLATQLAPFSWQSYSALAQTHMKAGDIIRAEEAYDKAIELAPSTRIPALITAREELKLEQQLISEPIDTVGSQ